jgi:mono/diheme cytochrome c family protein
MSFARRRLMKNFRRAFGYLVAAALLGLALAPNSAQAGPQASGGAATPRGGNAENGRKAFIKHSCFSCHGYEAEGGVGKRLVGYSGTLESLIAYVRQPGGEMPPAGAKISAAEFLDIYTWVRSIPPSPDAKSIPLLNP